MAVGLVILALVVGYVVGRLKSPTVECDCGDQVADTRVEAAILALRLSRATNKLAAAMATAQGVKNG